MKARRNFVVEFKSNRRQKKEAAASIWGDIDLKALARAVEDDLPKSCNASDAFSLAAAPPVEVSPDSGPPEAAVEPVDKSPLTAPLERMTRELVTKRDDTPLPGEAAEVPVPVSIPEMTSHAPVRPAAGTSPAAAAREEMPAQLDTAIPDRLGGFDDLVALAAENRRLKSVWKARLQHENAELRQMLDRVTKRKTV